MAKTRGKTPPAAAEAARADSSQGHFEEMPGTVTFVVGGQKYSVLEQTIRLRGESLLVDLMDEPGRGDKTAAIYIDADGERFRYILDWFRFGSLKLPSTISEEEMRRDCHYYKLPEDVQIECPSMGSQMATYGRGQKRAREESLRHAAVAAAHSAFDQLVSQPINPLTATPTQRWKPRSDSWKDKLVYAALTGESGLDKSLFKGTLKSLATQSGFEVILNNSRQEISLRPMNAIAPPAAPEPCLDEVIGEMFAEDLFGTEDDEPL